MPPVPTHTRPFHFMADGQAQLPSTRIMPPLHEAAGGGVNRDGSGSGCVVVLMPPVPAQARPFHLVGGGQAQSPSVRTMPPAHEGGAGDAATGGGGGGAAGGGVCGCVVLMPPAPTHSPPFNFVGAGHAQPRSVRTMPPTQETDLLWNVFGHGG